MPEGSHEAQAPVFDWETGRCNRHRPIAPTDAGSSSAGVTAAHGFSARAQECPLSAAGPFVETATPLRCSLAPVPQASFSARPTLPSASSFPFPSLSSGPGLAANESAGPSMEATAEARPSDRSESAAHSTLVNSTPYQARAFVIGLAPMLLQEERFACRLAASGSSYQCPYRLATEVDAQKIDALLEPVRLFLPGHHSYSQALEISRRDERSPSASLLLHVLLWLALPEIPGAPSTWNVMLRTVIRSLGSNLLRDRGKAQGVLAAEAFDILFHHWPVIFCERRPVVRPRANVLFGAEMLFPGLHPARQDPQYANSNYLRIYWRGLLVTNPFVLDKHPSDAHLTTLFDGLGAAGVRHRLALMGVVKMHERKLQELEKDFGESRPTDKLAKFLLPLLEAYIGAVAHTRGDLARDVGALSSRFAHHPLGQQAKQFLFAHFEQLSLALSVNFASYIAASNFRMTLGPLDKSAAEHALRQPSSSVFTLASFVTRFMDLSLARSLALMPLINSCSYVAWAVPPTERAMILCATTKHLMRKMAGYIYHDGKKPRTLEQSIVLLDAAARSAMIGASSRVRDSPSLKIEESTILEAVEHGDVLITAGRLAQRASNALVAWRERLYSESWSEKPAAFCFPVIGIDELFKTPGLLCDDKGPGREGQESAATREERKARLLAQLWVASRGEED